MKEKPIKIPKWYSEWIDFVLTALDDKYFVEESWKHMVSVRIMSRMAALYAEIKSREEKIKKEL